MLVIMMSLVLLAMAVIGIRKLLQAGTERTEDASIFAEIVPLSARVGGQVAKVLVQENQQVQQGDVLVQLDERMAEIEVARAEASLAIAQAQLLTSSSEVQVVMAQANGSLRIAHASLVASREQSNQVESLIAAAKADVAKTQQELQRATNELQRVEQLFASNMVSQVDLENARSEQELARASLAREQAQLLAARREKLLSESRIMEAQGRMDQTTTIEARTHMAMATVKIATTRITEAEQALELARLRRSLLKVVAPRDGTVSRLVAREGQVVESGQLLMQIVPPPTMVVANFKETQIGYIEPGQRVTILVDAYPGKPLEGRVLSLAGGTGASFSLLPPTNASGNFVKVVQRVPVRIALIEPIPVPLMTGLSVEAIVHTR